LESSTDPGVAEGHSQTKAAGGAAKGLKGNCGGVGVEFLIRFLAGGLIVAFLPILARNLGPELAGIAALLPLVTLSGFYFLGSSQGSDVVARASLASLIALPAVGAFLLAVTVSIRSGLAYKPSLLVGLGAWGLVAGGVAVALGAFP